MRKRTARVILPLVLVCLSSGSAWGLFKGSINNDGLDILTTAFPEIGAILLLGMALLGTGNLLRRLRGMQNRAFDSSLKTTSVPAPKAIGRELCSESSVPYIPFRVRPERIAHSE